LLKKFPDFSFSSLLIHLLVIHIRKNFDANLSAKYGIGIASTKLIKQEKRLQFLLENKIWFSPEETLLLCS